MADYISTAPFGSVGCSKHVCSDERGVDKSCADSRCICRRAPCTDSIHLNSPMIETRSLLTCAGANGNCTVMTADNSTIQLSNDSCNQLDQTDNNDFFNDWILAEVTAMWNLTGGASPSTA